jgi:hypothetical protein
VPGAEGLRCVSSPLVVAVTRGQVFIVHVNRARWHLHGKKEKLQHHISVCRPHCTRSVAGIAVAATCALLPMIPFCHHLWYHDAPDPSSLSSIWTWLRSSRPPRPPAQSCTIWRAWCAITVEASTRGTTLRTAKTRIEARPQALCCCCPPVLVSRFMVADGACCTVRCVASLQRRQSQSLHAHRRPELSGILVVLPGPCGSARGVSLCTVRPHFMLPLPAATPQRTGVLPQYVITDSCLVSISIPVPVRYTGFTSTIIHNKRGDTRTLYNNTAVSNVTLWHHQSTCGPPRDGTCFQTAP